MWVKSYFFLTQFLTHINFNLGLWCFQCSQLGNSEDADCPRSKNVINIWHLNPNKYVDGGDSNSISCALGYDQSKIVYYQATVESDKCSDENFLTTIRININKKSPIKNSEVLCCKNNGCNWNYTTTYQNLTYDQILSSNNGTSGAETIAAGIGSGWIALLILIGIGLLVACCICCLLGAKKSKTNDERSAQVSAKSELRVETPDIPVTPVRNINQVQVNSRDHERYSAIDKKIFRRNLEPSKGFSDYSYRQDSSGYNSEMSSAYSGADPVNAFSKGRIAQVSKDVFDREDFHQANQIVNPGPQDLRNRGGDWNHIWKSATGSNSKPAGGNPNAFSFN